jgi:arylsulfatase A-like enzyme
LVLSDDQGYGDFGFTGNSKIRTPNLDQISREGTHCERFYVCPVCSPTRASVLTGRYNYRTRVTATYVGRSNMDPAEVTLAEMLRDAGYRTGLFGKWHLGDHYPQRPMEQGFEEALYHLGGGLMQPSGPPDNHYFDPVLMRNGQPFKSSGYCSDIFTEAAIDFIERRQSEPFFCYLAFNAPHTPLEIDESWVAPYREAGLDDLTAKVYGMVSNIDHNLGRLLEKLKTLGLDENTIVVYLSDNGPEMPNPLMPDNRPEKPPSRYIAGLRSSKVSVYEGGIRTPCLIRWPARLSAGQTVEPISAHIDLAPTILDACGVPAPAQVDFDGRSLMPLLLGRKTSWPDRTLFFQYHYADIPQAWNNCAAVTQRYKLVNGNELYDLLKDPGEQHDISAGNPVVMKQMRAAYEAWFRDVCETRGFAPQPIPIGNPRENPVILTRQDWRPAVGWESLDMGWWVVQVERPGPYSIGVRFPEAHEGAVAHFVLGPVKLSRELRKGDNEAEFDNVTLPVGNDRLDAWIEAPDLRMTASYVDVKCMK